MGTKPCLKAGVIAFAGLMLAGCDSAQRNSNSVAKNAPTPVFPSGASTSTYANTTTPQNRYAGSTGSLQSSTPGTPSNAGFPTSNTTFGSSGSSSTMQPTTGFSNTQPTTGFGNTPPATGFGNTQPTTGFNSPSTSNNLASPSTPSAGSGSFATGSIPPVNSSGPPLPSNNIYPSTPTPVQGFGR
jgi:hypothetical protein